MRLLMLNEYFPPYAPGGAEWSLLQLVGALAERGHEVHVLVPDLGDGRVEVHPAVRVTRFPFGARLAAGRPLSPYVLANPRFYSRFGGHAARYLREHSADVIHAHNAHSMPAAVIAAMRANVPAVATVRDYRLLCPSAICLLTGDGPDSPCGFGRFHRCLSDYRAIYGGLDSAYARAKFRVRRSWEWLDWKLRLRYFESLAGAVFVGERIRTIHEAAGIRAARQESIHNIPPESAAPHPDPDAVLDRLGLAGRRIVLHAGRVSVGKGARILLDAARLLADRAPAAAFVLAGRMELAEGVPADLAGCVFAPGHLSHGDLAALYERAEVFVSAAVWQEPFSRSILEAMQHALPVVASDAGGNPEAVTDGETGVLVPRGDAGALADAVARLLDNGDARRAMGERGRRSLERFRADAVLERLEAFYLRVVEQGR